MDQQRQHSRCQQKLRYATGASEVHTHTPAPALPAHARQLGCFVQTFNLRFTVHSLSLVCKVSFQQATSDWRNTKPQFYLCTNDSQTQTLGWHTIRHVTKLCTQSQNTPTNAIQTNSVQIEPTAGSSKGGRNTTIFSLRWLLMEGFIPGGSSDRERLFSVPTSCLSRHDACLGEKRMMKLFLSSSVSPRTSIRAPPRRLHLWALCRRTQQPKGSQFTLISPHGHPTSNLIKLWGGED